MAVTDPAALLGAAVRAAVLARAPRRTVQAVAAAVTGVLVRPAEAASQRRQKEPDEDARGSNLGDACDGASAEELLQALRQKRAARRRQKKQSRRARKAQAAEGCEPHATDGRGGGEPKSENSSCESHEATKLHTEEPAFPTQATALNKQTPVDELDPEIPEDFQKLVQVVNEQQKTEFVAEQFTTWEERNVICNAAVFRESVADAMTPNVCGETLELPNGSPLWQFARHAKATTNDHNQTASKQPQPLVEDGEHGPVKGTSAKRRKG
eukprot:TRINITY_DN46623_c0_g1_i1.p1 TRINITY_DN46623_c0_g1~~TRINITY_DN46623_c0_g1_i1.p1  ORF type:complete len:268 (+),score=58.61 TRINITY_DN46623_c0_g1_i1:52-855(+)